MTALYSPAPLLTGRMRQMTRPAELKFAIAFAAAALLIDLAFIASLKNDLGDGWILLLFFRFFVSLIYLLLFVFAYNGRGWVRFVYSMLVIFGLIRYVQMDVVLLQKPFVATSVLFSFSAILLWFTPNTNNWYRSYRS